MNQRKCEIQRVGDTEALNRAAAGLFVRLARKAVADHGRFTVALSGGSTPRKLFETLSTEPFRERTPWGKIEFFWGDERAVGPESADSNFRMARETLLEGLSISDERIHRMRGEADDLDAAARAYQDDIARVFGVSADGPPPCLDLVFLGMGADGHTASLFPGTKALDETKRWVVANDVSALDTKRLTMTTALLNRAACVAFLVSGGDKAETLSAVLEGPHDPARLPSQSIRLENGRLIWFLDRAAAQGLTGSVMDRISIAPSILSADFARLGEDVKEAELAGADRVHVDVMDGHFVPNLSMGPIVLRGLRRVTRLPLETHLMITDPEDYVESFAEAGADSIIFHQEATDRPLELIACLRELGVGVGVSIRPATPASAITDLLDHVDLILIMTVEPGFGGQKLIPETIDKVSELRDRLSRTNPTCEIEVDGGIDRHTAGSAYEAGARVLVAGSAIFGREEGVDAALQHIIDAALSS